MKKDKLKIRGARQHNLKNLDISNNPIYITPLEMIPIEIKNFIKKFL